jgi:hypothetical protein
MNKNTHLNRRDFIKTTGSLAVAGTFSGKFLKSQDKEKSSKPKTNIQDALKIPRNDSSMPGKYPGKAIIIQNSKALKNGKFDYEQVSYMLDQSVLMLTQSTDRKKAWNTFFSPNDRIGIKVNPVGGKLLSTSKEIVRTIISELLNIGVQLHNITIWDRREFQLHEAGFNNDNFPGVNIIGTERKDKNGSFYDSKGKLFSEQMIDKEWYYWADVEGKYNKETLPYMVNEGKYSFFSKICTQMVDKIINVPVLKNAGNSVSLCLKNIAYGSITNTARLHRQLWAETCAEVPCFPPLRDKVVLNIIDGIKGCYEGGPAAKPEFITDFNSIIVSTDPVTADRIGYNIIKDKRIETAVQKKEIPAAMNFMFYAEQLGLGIANMQKINMFKRVI